MSDSGVDKRLQISEAFGYLARGSPHSQVDRKGNSDLINNR